MILSVFICERLEKVLDFFFLCVQTASENKDAERRLCEGFQCFVSLLRSFVWRAGDLIGFLRDLYMSESTMRKFHFLPSLKSPDVLNGIDKKWKKH